MIERLEHAGRKVWGIDTGLEPQGLEASSLVKQVRSPAWFFDGTWKPWPVQGVIERDGRLWIYGPDQGDFLLQGWDMLPLEEEQKRVVRFLEAVESAPDRTGPWLNLDHHRFLALPEYFLRSQNPGIKSWKLFGSPDLPPSRDRDWRSGALVWRLLSGEFPYDSPLHGGKEEEVRDRQRHIKLPPSRWVFPHLTPELAQVLDTSLDFGNLHSGIWRGWSARLPAPGPAPVSNGKIRRWETVQERKYARRLWWRRNRLRASLAVLGTFIISLLIGGIVLAAVVPAEPDPRPPREVVQTYYDTINAIRDRPLRELTRGTRDPVLQKEADEMARLFIFSELQITQIGGPGVLSAKMWEDAGRPALGNYQTLFGITDLVIREVVRERAAPDESSWEAVYRRWYSYQEQEGGKMLPRVWDIRQVTDRLSLNLTQEGWKIHRLEREENPVSMETGLP